MAKDQTRRFEHKGSNISEYLDRDLTIVDFEIIEAEGGFDMVTIHTKDGSEITCTSGVLAKQLREQQEIGLPFVAKIVQKMGKFPYYSFA